MRSTTEDLTRYANDIHKGVRSINLRTQMNPTAWERTRGVLATGSAEDLEVLLRETVDRTLGLLSGASPLGRQATELVLGMQAQALVWSRGQESPAIQARAGGHTLARWLERHEALLLEWIQAGTSSVVFGSCDLTELAHILDQPEVRRAASSPFIAAIAVLGEAMDIFTAEHEDSTPISRSTSDRAL